MQAHSYLKGSVPFRTAYILTSNIREDLYSVYAP